MKINPQNNLPRGKQLNWAVTEGPPGWLGYIGYFSSQVYGDYFMSHVINQWFMSHVRVFIMLNRITFETRKKPSYFPLYWLFCLIGILINLIMVHYDPHVTG